MGDRQLPELLPSEKPLRKVNRRSSLRETGYLTGWSALSDFYEGLMVEDLRANVEMALVGAGHVVLQYHDMLNEIRDLQSNDYTLVRAMSGPGSCLLEAAERR